MNWKLIVLLLMSLGFAALTGFSLSQVGYFGIWQAGIDNPGSLQVLVDLVIVCGLAIAWMIHDARSRGAAVWPYVLVTLVAGSFGPLAYLIGRELGARQTVRPAPRHG